MSDPIPLPAPRSEPICPICFHEIQPSDRVSFGLTEREVRDAVRELSSTRRFRVDIDTWLAVS